ncbi:hypothetical protein Droror1_Dr00021339 [Drosera rotundifolia]
MAGELPHGLPVSSTSRKSIPSTSILVKIPRVDFVQVRSSWLEESLLHHFNAVLRLLLDGRGSKPRRLGADEFVGAALSSGFELESRSRSWERLGFRLLLTYPGLVVGVRRCELLRGSTCGVKHFGEEKSGWRLVSELIVSWCWVDYWNLFDW